MPDTITVSGSPGAPVTVTMDPQTAYALAWRLYVATNDPSPAQLGAWLAAHAG